MNPRVPRRSPDFCLERLENELLLYHPERTTAIYLNETASLVWQLCDGEITAGEIATLLSEAFPDAGGTVATEVDTALARLEESGAIEFA